MLLLHFLVAGTHSGSSAVGRFLATPSRSVWFEIRVSLQCIWLIFLPKKFVVMNWPSRRTYYARVGRGSALTRR